MKRTEYAVQGRIGWAILLNSVLLLMILGGAPQARGQNDCNIIFDADDKLLTSDHHTFMTSTSAAQGSAPRTSESITVKGVTYIQVKGAWRKSPITGAEIREQKAENRKTAKNVSCHYLRDESVGGEAARVYSAHAETEDDKTDTTVWISKSRGLPLRQEEDIDVGGAGGKTHYSVRHEYTNVSAPSVQ
jgi:hypothetical protein